MLLHNMVIFVLHWEIWFLVIMKNQVKGLRYNQNRCLFSLLFYLF